MSDRRERLIVFVAIWLGGFLVGYGLSGILSMQ